MKLVTQTPKKALKAFLKQKPLRSEIDVFKTNLIALLDKIIAQKQKGEDTKANEILIDKMVYELYHITAEEQKLIEGN
jgi:hypothetical protein